MGIRKTVSIGAFSKKINSMKIRYLFFGLLTWLVWSGGYCQAQQEQIDTFFAISEYSDGSALQYIYSPGTSIGMSKSGTIGLYLDSVPNAKYYEKFFGGPAQVEKVKFKFDLSSYKYVAPVAFVSGMADGFNQALNYHYETGVRRVFPNINHKFWNPNVSWQNKYAIDPNGNVNTNYEAFPFSTSILVFLTDGHHLTRAVDHAGMYVAVGLNIHDIGNKNWKQILLDIGVTAFARSVGFATTYSIIFAD